MKKKTENLVSFVDSEALNPKIYDSDSSSSDDQKVEIIKDIGEKRAPEYAADNWQHGNHDTS